MAYQTGTAVSAADLVSTITTFATTYGWSSSGGWLSKGLSHVSLSANSPTTGYVGITGANSADGSTTPAGYTKYLYVPASEWPVTYYLFSQSNPDIIGCAINYATDWCEHLIFGDIVKVNSAAFTGGNFFHAPYANTAHTIGAGSLPYSKRWFVGKPAFIDNIEEGIHSTLIQQGGYTATNWLYQNSCIPLNPQVYGGSGSSRNDLNTPSGLHVEVDGELWDNSCKVKYTDGTYNAIYRSPSQWTSQAILVPINLCYAMNSSLYGYLGYMEHIRLLRIDNFNIADEINISPDTWKVFPLLRKDAAQADGFVPTSPESIYSYTNAGHTGTLGIAYRK